MIHLASLISPDLRPTRAMRFKTQKVLRIYSTQGEKPQSKENNNRANPVILTKALFSDFTDYNHQTCHELSF